jgi:hypothetical protein
VDPPVAQVDALKDWWENGGKTGKVTALSDKSGSADGSPVDAQEGSIAELKTLQENLVGDKKIDFTTVAYLSGCKTQDKEGNPRPITYDACPKTNRKLQGNYCNTCEKASRSKIRAGTSGLPWSATLGPRSCMRTRRR